MYCTIAHNVLWYCSMTLTIIYYYNYYGSALYYTVHLKNYNSYWTIFPVSCLSTSSIILLVDPLHRHPSDPRRNVTKLAVIQAYRVFCFLNKNQNAPRASEHPPVRGEKMSKRLGGIKGCKYKTFSWHLNGFPDDGNNIGSTV